ncbi:MAG: class I SAM-dependent methyltransferase [Terriglobia bacterium]
MDSTPASVWKTPEHALAYLNRADVIPHRPEGEAVLLDLIPAGAARILDLGSGSGRLVKLVRSGYPGAKAVALDFSPPMLQALEASFGGDASVTIVDHNLLQPLPDLGQFDAAVSSLAIHHLPHPRKRALYGEIYRTLAHGGVFLNLEHVSSPTSELHQFFLERYSSRRLRDDPSNIYLDVETQLQWLREIGFTNVDCYWKWLELALIGGKKPA